MKVVHLDESGFFLDESCKHPPPLSAEHSPPQHHRQSARRLHESARALDSYDLRLGGAIDQLAYLALLSGIS